MVVSLKVDGVWLDALCHVGELEYSTRFGGGSADCSWSILALPGWRHHALRENATVEVYDASYRVWDGLLDELDWEAGSFSASGLSREGEVYYCFDMSAQTTSILDDAIDGAISRGLPWVRSTSLSAVPYVSTAETDAANTLTQLLDAYCLSTGLYWYVSTRSREIRIVPKPTVPEFHLSPGNVEMGATLDNYASHVFVRYQVSDDVFANAAADAPPALEQRYGHREYVASATDLGIISAGQAGDIAAGILARGTATPAFTDRLTATCYELLTVGGEPAALSVLVDKAARGVMVRIHGLYDEINHLQYLDVVISEASVDEDTRTVLLTPLGMVGKDLASITAEVFTLATGQTFAA